VPQPRWAGCDGLFVNVELHDRLPSYGIDSRLRRFVLRATDGAPVSYLFAGDLGGLRAGSRRRVRTQSCDTSGFLSMLRWDQRAGGFHRLFDERRTGLTVWSEQPANVSSRTAPDLAARAKLIRSSMRRLSLRL